MTGSPEVLLRSALEKIVFFECRVASLESELDATRMNAARAREEAGAARRRETELEAALARARGEQAAAVAQNAELRERVRLLDAERERFLTGMVEAARVAGAPTAEDEDAGSEHHLAGFISELRAEIEQLRAWKQAAEAAGLSLENPGATSLLAPEPPSQPAAAAPVPVLALRFESDGRFGVKREDLRAATPTFSTRSERALYEASLDDLGSGDPGTRRRAADGLRALGSRTAAPLVAAALGRESEAEVKAALLAALGSLAEASAIDLAIRELSDARPAVRAAALEAAVALGRDRAIPLLAAALADPSALVRRRATMLLAFSQGEVAEDALVNALLDRDAGVARAAAVALAGRPSGRAQGALARALDHREAEVRRVAARAVGRWSGEAVDASAPEAERRTAARRIAEKLLTVETAELRTAVMRVPQAASARRRQARTGKQPGAPPRAAPGAARGGPAPVPAAALHAAVAVASPEPDPELAGAVVAEVRAALRGCTVDELSTTLARDRMTVEATLRALVAQGRLVVRGPRFFMS